MNCVQASLRCQVLGGRSMRGQRISPPALRRMENRVTSRADTSATAPAAATVPARAFWAWTFHVKRS